MAGNTPTLLELAPCIFDIRICYKFWSYYCSLSISGIWLFDWKGSTDVKLNLKK